jgi:MFS family permease
MRRAGLPLRIAAYRRLWATNLAITVGSTMQVAAAGWLVAQWTGSAERTAMVQSASTAAWMLICVPAGAVADNLDARRVMIAANMLATGAGVLLSLAIIEGVATPWFLIGATFVIASGSAMFSPAWQIAVLDNVPPEVREPAIGLNNISFNVARSIGPAIGGLLVAFGGGVLTFLSQALLSLFATISLLRWKQNSPALPLPPERLRDAVMAGGRFVRRSPLALRLILRGGLFGLCVSGLLGLAPLLVQQRLAVGASFYGALLAAFGLGALLGGVVRTGLALSRGRLILAGNLGAGSAIVAISVSDVPELSLTLMAMVGFCWVMVMTSLSVCLQLTTPRWVVGRIIAINQSVAYAGMAAGSACWGLAARYIGLETALLASGILALASAILDLRTGFPEGDGPDLTPLRAEPLDRIDDLAVEMTSLPVVITVDYNVAAEDAEAFAAMMRQLGLARRRDGALRWSLQQSLGATGIWRETFVMPTWLEYLRFQTRPTVADAGLKTRIKQLHKGDPVVGRSILRVGDGAVTRPTRNWHPPI